MNKNDDINIKHTFVIKNECAKIEMPAERRAQQEFMRPCEMNSIKCDFFCVTMENVQILFISKFIESF